MSTVTVYLTGVSAVGSLGSFVSNRPYAPGIPPLPRLTSADPATILRWAQQLVAALERQSRL